MADRGGGALVTHFSVRTYYTFHYRAKTRKGVAPTASHYATLPFESMFTGLFLEEQAATAYNEMYGSAVAPTSPMVLKNNAERMMNVGIKAMRRDDMPARFEWRRWCCCCAVIWGGTTATIRRRRDRKTNNASARLRI